jgi:tRNA-specific 2-thiouridylase
VIKLDPKENTVWVGEEDHLFKNRLEITKTNWMQELKESETYTVKIRFHHVGAPAKITLEQEKTYIEFQTPQRAITPGQAAAIYEGNKLVGGGWII